MTGFRLRRDLLAAAVGVVLATGCYEHNVGSPGGPGGASGLPPNACVYGDQDRAGCAGARIIGRSPEANGWMSGAQETCGDENIAFGECSPHTDEGFDHTYAIFVRAGETVSVSLFVEGGQCENDEQFNSLLKIRTNTDATEGGATTCPVLFGCWTGPVHPETWALEQNYSPTQDEWVFIIVDGGEVATEQHRGFYNLSVGLTGCADPNCGC